MALCTHTYADGKTCPRQAVKELRCEFHSPSYTIIRFTRDARHIALEFGHTGTKPCHDLVYILGAFSRL
jgi:hypothetical protein